MTALPTSPGDWQEMLKHQRLSATLTPQRSISAAIAVACLATVWTGSALSAPSAAELTDPKSVQAGKERFMQLCAYCHGEQGDAGKHRPFRERIDWDADFVHDTISEGRRRGANVMPAWKDSLSDDEIWRIVAYIKSIGGQTRKPD
ncbi:MAG TPA: cytochrome c [Burkholderiaceae bacterium]|nr:cytochrome c [Burkholderiaceae bacterium]